MERSDISTERLYLRPLVVADADALRELTDDPTIAAAISFLHVPFTIVDARTLIARNANGQDLFRGILRQPDRMLVGVIGAHARGTGTVEIGYWIGVAFQGRGYALEAASGLVGRLKAEIPGVRIVAECRPGNRISWRLLERLGFRPTGAPGTRPGRLELALPVAKEGTCSTGS